MVGVFDRGEHDGTYYIAMEHLPGRTLKEIVNTQAPLPQEMVIDLGLQILAAAGFAHRHHVIHRDFKPHNVIVDDAWQAKVTDFGIARAGASEMTETGSIMGTAQYLSPEQAQGHAVAATSDIYSIGVILYELLTGRVPFQGDSAVAVALKHLSEPPTPISQLRPDVHPTLESVVMAALAKDPAQRWQTAEEFAAALSTARDQIESGASGPRDTAEFMAAPVLVPTDPAANGGSPPERKPPPGESERRWPWFTIGILALALLALLGFLAVSGLLSADKKEVPRVVGKQLIEARQKLERAGFDVKTERVKSPADLDDVVDQDPNGGEQADEGSTVTLVVSNGPGNALVPSVEGQTRTQAIRTLERAHFDVTVSDEPSETVPDGTAIRTFPRQGTSVEQGSRVTLKVSSGPEQITVPDVTGLSRGSAEDSLTREGLKVSVREESSDQPKDDVVSQDPAGGTQVDSGSRVTITVSTGPEQVEVPDVTGLEPRGGDPRAEGGRAEDGRAGVRHHRSDAGRRGGETGAGLRRRGGQGQHRGHLRGRVHSRRGPREPGAGQPVRVAVLGGGRSSEHEVSLRSAESVRAGLAEAGHEPVEILLERDGRWMLEGEPMALEPGGGLAGADAAFPVLHGPFGEDGTVQGLLELFDVPYVGAAVAASALAMDKSLFKDLLAAHGVPQVEYAVARHGRPLDLGALALPLFVKPARLGSSVGISKAWSEEELDRALEHAFQHDPVVMVERLVEGAEVECSVLGHRDPIASRPGEIVLRADSGWYDFEAKYGSGGMELIVPARLPDVALETVRRLALEVFGIVGCSGMARVDFFVEDGRVLVNELNTIPGFTATSVYAKLLEADGIAYPELLDRLVRLGVERHEEDRKYRY